MAQPPYGSPSPYGAPPPMAPLPSYTPQAGANQAAIAPGGEPDINQPWYGIGFVPALIRPFKKYAQFNGRASRGELWWFYLAYVGVMVVFSILMSTVGMSYRSIGYGYSIPSYNGFGVFLMIVMILIGLAAIVPFLALSWRRLHDTNRSGVWYLIALVPFVGEIILIVFLASPTYQGPTQWDQPGSIYGTTPAYGAMGMPAAPYAYQPAPPVAPQPTAGYQPYQAPVAPPQAQTYGTPPAQPYGQPPQYPPMS